ncbi:MAG: hypothetical protein KC620_15140, partial [Myxococcales bacterium]|nr:hypothetical protein [Myxococcales bacterium]
RRFFDRRLFDRRLFARGLLAGHLVRPLLTARGLIIDDHDGAVVAPAPAVRQAAWHGQRSQEQSE